MIWTAQRRIRGGGCGKSISQHNLDGRVVRASASGAVDLGLIPWLLDQIKHNIRGYTSINRRGLPKAIKQTTGREPFSYEYFWENEKGRLVLHSYVVKTKSTGLRTCYCFLVCNQF